MNRLWSAASLRYKTIMLKHIRQGPGPRTHALLLQVTNSSPLLSRNPNNTLSAQSRLFRYWQYWRHQGFPITDMNLGYLYSCWGCSDICVTLASYVLCRLISSTVKCAIYGQSGVEDVDIVSPLKINYHWPSHSMKVYQYGITSSQIWI